MLPLLKVLTLFFKVFSKPMISYTKKYHMARKDNHSNFSKRFLVYFGNKWHLIETRINRRFLNISQTDFKIKDLNPNDALEKGLEYFYEIIFYSFLILLPLYEMRKGGLDNARKSKDLNQKLTGIEKRIAETKDLLIAKNNSQNEEIKVFTHFFERVEDAIQDLNETNEKMLKDAEKEVNEVSNDTRTLIDQMMRNDEQLTRMLVNCQRNQSTLEKLL